MKMKQRNVVETEIVNDADTMTITVTRSDDQTDVLFESSAGDVDDGQFSDATIRLEQKMAHQLGLTLTGQSAHFRGGIAVSVDIAHPMIALVAAMLDTCAWSYWLSPEEIKKIFSTEKGFKEFCIWFTHSTGRKPPPVNDPAPNPVVAKSEDDIPF